MEFTTFTQVDAAAGALMDFLRSKDGRAMPRDIQDQAWDFLRPGGSISFAVAYFAELLFARKEEVDGPALVMAASCAALGALNNIDNLGGDRGPGIMMALLRRAGKKAPIGQSWPKAEDDPAPRKQFVVSH